ncbi:hypothetical protein EMCRGX_G021140 [Ephydatia muelleri]
MRVGSSFFSTCKLNPAQASCCSYTNSGIEEAHMASDGPPEKKRKRSDASGEPSVDPRLQQNDFICPICFEVWDEVYVTVCGHSFCFRCITKVIGQIPQCPVCKTTLPVQNPIHPNFSLHDIVTKYRQQSVTSQGTSKTPAVHEILKLTSQIGDRGALKELCLGIQEQLQNSAQQEQYLCTAVTLDFLERTRQVLLTDLGVVQSRLSLVEKDIAQFKLKAQVVPDPDMSVPTPLGSDVAAGTSDASLPAALFPGTPLFLSTQETLSMRKMRVEANMTEIISDYFETRMPVVEEEGAEDTLDQFSDGLYRFTRYSTFRELSGLVYTDPNLNSSIVSSIEFDKDGEYLAVAGVSKKIKIFNYYSVIKAMGFTNHFPEQEMACTAKLSSLCYNPYHKARLVSSDYDGAVCVWDTNTGTRLVKFQEHEKRVWSVVYNPTEPNLFASGSDDCTVKLWSSNRPQSCYSLPAKANVCCVRFHPTNRYNIAYGSADHIVHYMDLRKPSEPVAEFKGHRKAVSYVHFINNQELVSASTDSELKLWDINKGIVRTYKGHVNEKNFVGLSVTPHFIACGSENNSFYVYCKQVSNHMLKYTFNVGRSMLPDTSTAAPESGEDLTNFVSSVRWRKDSNVILAANSQGVIKVLEMC